MAGVRSLRIKITLATSETLQFDSALFPVSWLSIAALALVLLKREP